VKSLAKVPPSGDLNIVICFPLRMSFVGNGDNVKEHAKEGSIIEVGVNDKDAGTIEEALAGS